MRCSYTLVILWSGRSIGGPRRLWPLIISWLLLMCYWLPLHSHVHPPPEGEDTMKTKVVLIITLTASVALFFPFFVHVTSYQSHRWNQFVSQRVGVVGCCTVKKKTKKHCRELCAHSQVFCFVCVCRWKKAQLQRGATLALIKHPCQSIGLIRCFVFFPQTLKWAKSGAKGGGGVLNPQC